MSECVYVSECACFQCVCVCVFTEYVCDVHVCVENVRFMCRYVSAEVCACVCVREHVCVYVCECACFQCVCVHCVCGCECACVCVCVVSMRVWGMLSLCAGM